MAKAPGVVDFGGNFVSLEIPGPPAVRLGASINGRWKWRGDTEFRDGGSTSGDRSVVRDFGVPKVEKLEHRRSVSPQDGRAAAIVAPGTAPRRGENGASKAKGSDFHEYLWMRNAVFLVILGKWISKGAEC